jgi:hypothetical protein
MAEEAAKARLWKVTLVVPQEEGEESPTLWEWDVLLETDGAYMVKAEPLEEEKLEDGV